jgi:NAD(P)-dependent dehydrogenase (short-subunit alcohol dehydrogenase family)
MGDWILRFNNAGVGGGGLVHELDEKVWDRVINTNLKGVWLCMKYQIAQMHKNDGGAIVNNSSVAGQLTPPRYVAYSASKHGVIAITKVAAVENAKEGIRINAVCPGFIETPMIEDALNNPESHAHILASGPMGRVGHLQEISDAVIWLCSKASSFVTGHALVVDGGLVIGRL